MTTLPTQPNFIHIIHNLMCEVNSNRGCFFSSHNSRHLLLGDLPTQFTLSMTLTKASIKRGLKKKAIALFTEDNWYAVQLDETKDKLHTVVFQMNPSYSSEIMTNRDKYQYEMLINNLAYWDQPQKNLNASALLQPRSNYVALKEVELTFKKLYYDHLKSSESSFQNVLLFVANQYGGRPPCQPQIKKVEDTVLLLLKTECAKVLLGTKSYANPHKNPVDFHSVISRNLK